MGGTPGQEGDGDGQGGDSRQAGSPGADGGGQEGGGGQDGMPGGDGGEEGGQGGDSRQAGGGESGDGGMGGEDGSGQGGDSRQASGGQEAGDGGFGGETAGAGGKEGAWPGSGASGTGAAGRASDAEGIFNDSLEDFDEIMGAEQEAIARGGIGSAADEGFGGAGGMPGGDGSMPGGGADGGGNVPTGGSAGGGGGSDPASRRPILARAELPEEAPPPVEGCEDTDKVARQLCEAATKEEDPLLRAALWDEYNEYKKIIALQ